MKPTQLLTTSPPPGDEELFETLLQRNDLHLKRIVSPAHFRSAPFQQAEDEWVLVLQGHATLALGENEVQIQQGESLLIPRGLSHQVLDTSQDPLCIWLALHLPDDKDRA